MSKTLKHLVRSISWALSGIALAFRTQFNFRFHVFSAIMVFILSVYFRISAVEWCILLLCVASVITAELLNTSLEFNTDLLSPGYSEVAKNVKDLAAAAVLIVSIVSAVIGGIIFIPKILHTLNVT